MGLKLHYFLVITDQYLAILMNNDKIYFILLLDG